MRGLMMDYPLTIPAIVRRVETLFSDRKVVSRRADRTICRSTYRQVVDRVRRLGVALQDLGVKPGDRVATLSWASQEHLEAYLAIPSIGAVLHTLNLRLHPDDLSYIVNDASDRVLIVDESLLPLYERFQDRVNVEHVIVVGPAKAGPHLSDGHGTSGAASGSHAAFNASMAFRVDGASGSGVASGSRVASGSGVASGSDVASGFSRTERVIAYEDLLASVDPARYVEPSFDEHAAAAMCYTSGTTGRPKGVLYSHRAVILHSFGQGLVDTLGVGERDTILPIVPMFHVNAWGLPFTATLFGAGQVFPGPQLDAKSVLELIVRERVTLTAGVPTVWLGVLQELDQHPGEYDVSALRGIVIGGSAAPAAMIRGYKERHGLDIIHAWGMTEMTPLGTLCNLPSTLLDAPSEDQFRYRAKQGTPLPFVELRAATENGPAPWDGTTMGELEVRGPWVAAQYYNVDGPDDRFTDDGWFRTGDIVTIDPSGCIELTDRAKDLVKSGGEWISSVALETALMGHPCVAEAAVVAVPHPKWDERPLAVVVLKPGTQASKDDLIAFLAPQFAKWWLPDAVEFAAEIPRTSVGKFKKSVLRDQYRNRYQTA